MVEPIDPATLEPVGRIAEADAVEVRAALVSVTGGRVPPDRNRGWFYEPTILTGCTDDMDLLRSGCFGPVAAVVWVNNPLIDNDALPFGGWNASDLGRELGRQGLDAFRRTKMVIVDHAPKVQDWWYTYPDDWFLDAGGRRLG